MKRIQSAIIPKKVFAGIRQSRPSIQVSQALVDSAALDAEGVYRKFETQRDGLSASQASLRQAASGANVLAKDQRVGDR